MAEYIDREKIREEVCKDCTRRIGKDGCMAPEACEDLLTALVAADPADVAPVVHGTWLESISMEPAFGGGFMPRRTYFCSECGMREKRKWSYCHCGAKMDGGEKDAQVPT